ncbi:hypothetical protein GCM10009069_09360 [Algimonas arctica]|uniref:Uncharacterized protein n=2 Tax=Algimonas arctica TaxID=1479486 RepID=A0A8J3CQZ4_9PROT|nr:hypothetical protein GCM10009069_09360 [Algimonas arctica]
MGAIAIAGTGCAYQGSSYGAHSPASYPTPYYGGCGSSYTPQGCQNNVGGTRFDLELGAEQFVSGDIIGAGNALGGGDTTLDVGYKDAFKSGYRVAAGLARDINPSTTVSAKGFYNEADGEDGVLFGSGGQTASFSDYKSYGAELGLRKYVGYGGAQLRPYLGGTVGAAYVDDISADDGGGPIVLNDATWVPTASGTAGFEMPLSQTGAIALEAGLRWTGKQDRAAGLGLGEDSSRLSVPVTLRGSFRF